MRGTGEQSERWNFSVRAIPGIPVDRAKLRLTATYGFLPNLWLGVEYNPLGDDIGLLGNWRAIEETENGPALILGTSSDRIGTPTGRAYYATVAKDIEGWTGLPVAPYVGAAYGEFDDEIRAIGGLGIRWAREWRSTHLYDGYNLHHVLDYDALEQLRIGAVLVQQGETYYVGVSVGSSL